MCVLPLCRCSLCSCVVSLCLLILVRICFACALSLFVCVECTYNNTSAIRTWIAEAERQTNVSTHGSTLTHTHVTHTNDCGGATVALCSRYWQMNKPIIDVCFVMFRIKCLGAVVALRIFLCVWYSEFAFATQRVLVLLPRVAGS